jgi:hypothetical protein
MLGVPELSSELAAFWSIGVEWREACEVSTV